MTYSESTFIGSQENLNDPPKTRTLYVATGDSFKSYSVDFNAETPVIF